MAVSLDLDIVRASFTAAQLDAMTSLKLAALPVALAFLPGPPAGLSKIDAGDPAGCSYWKRASEGQAFYTRASTEAEPLVQRSAP